MTTETPTTAEWLAAFERDLLAVGFTERRIDRLLAIAFEQTLDDVPLTLSGH